ncbi:DUF2283 domain-containing protein [Metabacillus indicus]|uniref:DUF2283 domain-containing protein n=1 Tax=Metabacillus indicus TaxID=246786 RepID=UPI000493571D|nr:DUF2283 domain-containing protein [Metabacillus indicus]KEZ52495.1 hypothetical protein AZ46_0201575 [Metabacillus indicus LMG 22858]
MKAKVSYDSDADMGYIYLYAIENFSIKSTEELDVNPFVSLDIDKKETITGIELAGDEAAGLKDLLYKGESYSMAEHLYSETGNGLSLRISEKAVKSRYRVSGITLCFSEEEYKGFVGFDLDIPEK